MTRPLSIYTFLYGRPKTEEEIAEEAEQERLRLERIANMPPADHKDKLDKAIVEIRQHTKDLYDQVQKRRKLWWSQRLRKITLPRIIRDVKIMGARKTLTVLSQAALAAGLCHGVFVVCEQVEALIGWGFYMTIICAYQWKETQIHAWWNSHWMSLKYPDGIPLEHFKDELKCDEQVASTIFDIIQEAAPSTITEKGGKKYLDLAYARQFINPPVRYENLLEMIYNRWDYEKHGNLIQGQLTPVVLSLMDADLIHPQEGAVFTFKDVKDFPPNWKEPLQEEVLAWPLAFDMDDQKTKIRAANQVVEELFVVHGMQFEGENLEGELSSLQFQTALRYLAARGGLSSVDELRQKYLRWVAPMLLKDLKEKADKEKEESDKAMLNIFGMFMGRRPQLKAKKGS